MSRVRSVVVEFKCDGHGYMQSKPCDGHKLYVEACLSSDTVSVTIDDKTELVLSDEGYSALEDAMANLRISWGHRHLVR
jgi:hypothetical protein